MAYKTNLYIKLKYLIILYMSKQFKFNFNFGTQKTIHRGDLINFRKDVNVLDIFKFKDVYRPVVPLNVYLTWHTKNLPPKMRENLEYMKRINPGFNFYLFDDNDCLNFIKAHFDEYVVDAFNKLIPGAYKADLWRLCVLYINGGFYLDIKHRCVNNFRLIMLSEDEHYTLDRPKGYIYNAIMVCKAGNDFLKKCIERIVINVNRGYYGPDALSPTGPGLLGRIKTQFNFPLNIDLTHSMGGGQFTYQGKVAFKCYPEYDTERNIYGKTKHYSDHWNNKNIYK